MSLHCPICGKKVLESVTFAPVRKVPELDVVCENQYYRHLYIGQISILIRKNPEEKEEIDVSCLVLN